MLGVAQRPNRVEMRLIVARFAIVEAKGFDMTPTELIDLLTAAKNAPDFVSASEQIAARVKAGGVNVQLVRVILEFMEANPEVDFGAPGPLTHLIEKLYGKGYEAELLASLVRTPTTHSIWLLNRVINGTRQIDVRQKLIEAMHNSTMHPRAQITAKQQAAEFLQRLERMTLP
jgi:hypothetical protein